MEVFHGTDENNAISITNEGRFRPNNEGVVYVTTSIINAKKYAIDRSYPFGKPAVIYVEVLSDSDLASIPTSWDEFSTKPENLKPTHYSLF